jgi:type II secretory ATPase GspE/PulE/Tfp pilus assembly ATPase PilB-like protein
MPQVLDDSKLKELVTTSKALSEDKIIKAEELAKSSDISLYSALSQKPYMEDSALGTLMADYYKLPFVPLVDIEIPDETLFLLPEEVARKNKVVVFSRSEEGTKITTAAPGQGVDYLKVNLEKKTGKPVTIYFSTPRDLENALFMYAKNLQYIIEKLLAQGEVTTPYGVERDPPVEKIVDTMVETAFVQQASDIHIEPQDNVSLVRFRIDGILHDVIQIPESIHDRLVTRIKVMSGLRTDEHQAAQDGKIHKVLNKEDVDFRVSIIPIVDGEKIVIRILASNAKNYTLSNLGMREEDLARVKKAFGKTYGMILSTGPTGSGKTTSIYAILKILNSRDKNITSIEDPVEYRIKGANQIQVNTKTNLTFANGLRSILRQDPDHVFVGEIRDNETAGIAVNAALTGHLVMSTLHTNNAATAIPRLIDMKVEPFLVASTVNIVIAQRLVRKICDNCKTSFVIPKKDLLSHFPPEIVDRYYTGVGKDDSVRVYKGAGCKLCQRVGYYGRVGIYEVLEVSNEIKKIINESGDADKIEAVALKEGMTSMLDDGVAKMSKGLTTLEEILRVIKTEEV